MVYRYRTNLKKVFLTDPELHQLNERIAKSNCKIFLFFARKVLLNPNMFFVTINTDVYDCSGCRRKRAASEILMMTSSVIPWGENIF